MARSQTSIRPAIAARLSSFTTATIGPDEVTVVSRGHAFTVTRREFEKLREADDRFVAQQEFLAAATRQALEDAA